MVLTVALAPEMANGWNMKRVLFLVVALFGSLTFPGFLHADPVKVIFETDLGGDVDDVGALSVLNKLADGKECEILACNSNLVDQDKAAAAAIDAINTYYGRPNIPIGTYQGTVYPNKVKSPYTSQLRDEFPHTAKPDDQQPKALDVYRKTLAAAPDGSVKIVSVGFLINLEDLLKSPPDANSPLSGVDLVKKKVQQLVVMGGAYPAGGEWNFQGAGSGPHTQYVVENWPTPILFSGFEIGGAITTGKLAAADPKSPVRRAYELFNHFSGRQSWDLTAVLAAVRDPEIYWTIQKDGYCKVDPQSGNDSWTATPNHGDSYLVAKVPPADMGVLLDGLISMPPGVPPAPAK
jgi:purine nucleosidase